MVQWNCTLEEAGIIRKIVKRAIAEALIRKEEDGCMDMDLSACHSNGCKLDLLKLLNAKASDFGHDILGIRRYIDRRTGKLTKHFDPRCSRPDRENT